MSSLDGVRIERAEFSPELVTDLGVLLRHMSETATGPPISEARLRVATDSPFAEQLVAYQYGKLVGAAALTQLAGEHGEGWLNDFVVDPTARGSGVADLIADEWEVWSREHDIEMLKFTSGWGRVAAHKFYLKRGARILNSPGDPTAFFNYPIPPVNGAEL